MTTSSARSAPDKSGRILFHFIANIVGISASAIVMTIWLAAPQPESREMQLRQSPLSVVIASSEIKIDGTHVSVSVGEFVSLTENRPYSILVPREWLSGQASVMSPDNWWVHYIAEINGTIVTANASIPHIDNMGYISRTMFEPTKGLFKAFPVGTSPVLMLIAMLIAVSTFICDRVGRR